MKNHSPLYRTLLAVGLVGCSVITDPSGLVGTGPVDAGARDGGGLDAERPDDAQLPDGCVITDEVCNELDDDCDGTVDEEPTECSFANGITGCVSGACALVGCVDDYGDCDDSLEGCESHLPNDRLHCGECDVACAVTERCVSSSCAAPIVRWSTLVSGVGSGYVQSVQFDGSRNPHIRGRSDGEGVFAGAEVVDGLWFVARLEPSDGSVSWFQALLPNPSGTAELRDMATTDLGIVHVVGSGTGVATTDGFPLTGGNFLWDIRPNGTTRNLWSVAAPTTGFASVESVDILSADDLVITGYLEGELNSQVSQGRDVLVLTGAPDSLDTFARGGAGFQEGRDIVATPDGGLCVAGVHIGETDFGGGELPSRTSGLDAFIACFTTGGVHRWSYGYSGPGQDVGQSLTADDDGNIYLLVFTDGGLTIEGVAVDDSVADRAVVVSYTPGGSVRWAVATALQGFAGSGSVSIATDGSVLLAGGAGADLGIGGASVPNAGGSDAVVVSLDSADGHLLWARAWGGSDNDSAFQAVGEEGELFVAGSFRDVARFDEVVTADANDGFVLSTD